MIRQRNASASEKICRLIRTKDATKFWFSKGIFQKELITLFPRNYVTLVRSIASCILVGRSCCTSARWAAVAFRTPPAWVLLQMDR